MGKIIGIIILVVLLIVGALFVFSPKEKISYHGNSGQNSIHMITQSIG